jgi:hypothetical protein
MSDWKAQLDQIRLDMAAQVRKEVEAKEAEAPKSVSLTLAELDALDACRCRSRRQTLKVVGVDGPISYSDFYCFRNGGGEIATYAVVEPKPVPEGHWAKLEVRQLGERLRLSGSYEAMVAHALSLIAGLSRHATLKMELQAA